MSKSFPKDRDKIIAHNDQTREYRFIATMRRMRLLRKAGYRVIEATACKVREIYADLPSAQTKSYPHAILYDLEAYGDSNQRKELTPTLTIENAQVPISVSIFGTLEREPTHICERDPTELARKFMEELESRGKNIWAQVRAEVMPIDVTCFQKRSGKNGGIVRSGACHRVELGQLRSEPDQKSLRGPPC